MFRITRTKPVAGFTGKMLETIKTIKRLSFLNFLNERNGLLLFGF